jgi:hypothetical protein
MIGYLVLGVAIMIVSIDFIQLSFREPLDLEEVYSNRVYWYGVLFILLGLIGNSRSFGDVLMNLQNIVSHILILVAPILVLVGWLMAEDQAGRKRPNLSQ